MTLQEESIKIVKGGVVSGDEKTTDATIPSTDTFVSYGGSSDLWGLSWTDTDINASDFGAVFASVGTEQNRISNYLKATNFGFSIPSGATINGIELEVEQKASGAGTSSAVVSVDLMRITVTYTESVSNATIQGITSITGVTSITI